MPPPHSTSPNSSPQSIPAKPSTPTKHGDASRNWLDASPCLRSRPARDKSKPLIRDLWEYFNDWLDREVARDAAKKTNLHYAIDQFNQRVSEAMTVYEAQYRDYEILHEVWEELRQRQRRSPAPSPEVVGEGDGGEGERGSRASRAPGAEDAGGSQGGASA